MTDYTTITGETWRASGKHKGLFVDPDGWIVTGTALCAELLALRAQRDELLAALESLAEDDGLTRYALAQLAAGEDGAMDGAKQRLLDIERSPNGDALSVADAAIDKVRNTKPAAQEKPKP